MATGRSSCYSDLLPFVALAGKECVNTGLHTLFKAATMKGMSHHVFVAYANVVATIVLLPAPFLSKRLRVVPPLNFSVLSKTALLGLLGSSSQILGYAGLSYTSPTLYSAIANLVPAFTFFFAIIFRMEKIAVKSRSSQAKVLGSITSICGAFVMTFYQGPSIIIFHTPLSLSSLHQPISILNSVDRNWVIGSLLLISHNLLMPLWYILQVEILKVYPDEVSMVFFYNLFGAIFAVIVGLITERNASAWKIGLDMSLLSIVSSGIFSKIITNVIYAWALHLKGPLYVAMFKPLSIVVAALMGFMFLGDSLHIGSLVGGTIISIGFYTVLWGKAKEVKEEEVGNLESTTATENVPLLQSFKIENSENKIGANVLKTSRNC